jgi:hypothetical protein
VRKKYFIIISLIQILFSEINELLPEKLLYTVSFRYFTAGNAMITINNDTLNGNPIYELETFVKTNKFLDNFYKIRDKTTMLINPSNYSLLQIDKNINEGNYNRKHSAYNQGDTLLFWDNKQYKINSPIYDPISFMYYLRTKETQIGDKFNFLSATSKGPKEVEVYVTKKETIRVSGSSFECLKIEPKAPDDQFLLKNNGEMKIWLSNDKNKIPIKIEMKTNIGNIIMKLNKSEGI